MINRWINEWIDTGRLIDQWLVYEKTDGWKDG